MNEEYSPFDFIKSASFTKEDLVKKSDTPEHVEKQYNAYMVNKGFSFLEDSILHANEMNRMHWLFKDAQYRYYLGSLRKRNRFSKWHKPEKNKELEIIQEHFQCNINVAKQYMKILTSDNIAEIVSSKNKGG